MKKIIFLLSMMIIVLSCNAPVKEEATESEASTIALPYTATYSSKNNQDVSDQDLLTVLNSYKAWETGDMQMLRASFGDSINFTGWDGTRYLGPSEGLMSIWAPFRDSLSSVKIEMAAWTKLHAIDKNDDWISVWYKEVDTYKNGKKDSAWWQDDNMVKNGKIAWYFQHRQAIKPNK